MYLSEAITGQLQKTYLCKQCPATLGAQKKSANEESTSQFTSSWEVTLNVNIFPSSADVLGELNSGNQKSKLLYFIWRTSHVITYLISSY